MPFAGASGLLQATFPGIVCILDGDRSGAVEVRGPPRPASRRGLGDDRGVHRDRRGGGLSNTLFSNYARDKGWGMGARVGAIPSAIGGRTIGLSHTCCVFPLNEENLSRWRRWMRHIRRDQAIWVLASILGAVIATLCVAASIAVGLSAILTGSRTRPSDRGSNARFGPVEDQRLLVLSLFSRSDSPDLVAVTFHLPPFTSASGYSGDQEPGSRYTERR